MTMQLRGWVELNGKKLTRDDVGEIVRDAPGSARGFGGEFLLSWGNCAARDTFGIIPGGISPGSIICNGKLVGRVDPSVPVMDLGEALKEAVRLRCDQGVVALSGGVDSSLVAALAGLPCLAAGIEGSFDLERAGRAATLLGLECDRVVIRRNEIEDALRRVLEVIPQKNPVDASIATTLYFVAREAAARGHERVLSGQGADELFGGYARYLSAPDPEAERERDIAGLMAQGERDQAVASLHGVYLSLPYLDLRVFRSARSIPAGRLIQGGVRKHPLRLVAERHIPPELAFAEKKAMQYGSGISNEIRKLARLKGFHNVRDYLGSLLE
ncbi:MAG: asparagine synthase C-terminal domain-containing protein [Methanolinea sp.]|nr:asparagine synthase C-terminal domain-containing protein [Methanolinea sp.]